MFVLLPLGESQSREPVCGTRDVELAAHREAACPVCSVPQLGCSSAGALKGCPALPGPGRREAFGRWAVRSAQQRSAAALRSACLPDACLPACLPGERSTAGPAAGRAAAAEDCRSLPVAHGPNAGIKYLSPLKVIT